LGKRLMDLARANLNALLERAAGDARVEELSDDELQAELSRRKARRDRDAQARAAAHDAEKAARGRAEARGRKVPPRTAKLSPEVLAERKLRGLYATLEVPFGSDLETVKSSFRRLMRKHHPDVNAGSPEKLKQSTARAAEISAAYQELETVLKK
jgi:DnaJ-domain-containing protein 1